MTVYKYYLKTFIRNKRYFFIWIGIFAIITFIIAGFPVNEKKELDNKSFKIAVSDSIKDKDVVNLENLLKNESEFIKIDNSENSAREEIFLHGTNIAIIEDDNDKLIAFYNQADINSYIVMEKINSLLNFVEITKDVPGSKNDIDLASKISKLRIKTRLIKDEKEADYISIWYYFTFRFLAYPLMAVIMATIGVGIISLENEKNQKRRMISSISIFKYKSYSFLAQILSTIIILLLAFLIVFAMGGYSDINYLAYLSNIFAFSMSSLGFIFLLININNNKYFVTSVANILPLCLSFISGVFVPSEFLPSFAVNLSRFFPMFYYIKSNKLASNGFSNEFWTYFGIQILFAIVLFLSGISIEKIKNNKKIA